MACPSFGELFKIITPYNCEKTLCAGNCRSPSAFIHYAKLFGHWKHFWRPRMLLWACLLLGRQTVTDWIMRSSVQWPFSVFEIVQLRFIDTVYWARNKNRCKIKGMNRCKECDVLIIYWRTSAWARVCYCDTCCGCCIIWVIFQHLYVLIVSYFASYYPSSVKKKTIFWLIRHFFRTWKTW